MNQEEFIKKLRDNLDIFEDNVIDEEVNHYVEEIEKQKNQNINEEQIIASFGNLDTIQKSIFKKHGINPSKVLKKEGFLYKKFEELFEVIHRVVDIMSKNSFQENIKILFDLLILIIFICLLKIPFILVRNLGDSLFTYTSIPLISEIWGILIDLIYIVIAVMVFVNIFTKWFKNLKVTKKIKGKALDSISLEDSKKDEHI